MALIGTPALSWWCHQAPHVFPRLLHHWLLWCSNESQARTLNVIQCLNMSDSVIWIQINGDESMKDSYACIAQIILTDYKERGRPWRWRLLMLHRIPWHLGRRNVREACVCACSVSLIPLIVADKSSTKNLIEDETWKKNNDNKKQRIRPNWEVQH